ncbi:hypothetical protein ACHAL6_04285 [Proteiniclasticum sp. C24MP]|uniref:hypothetical protein n=1 Tax=Proteiniclasticum sp. C24MP TaxID=3374101 RepID=UPI0037553E31
MMTATQTPLKYKSSAEESPVILLGLLNEEMRGAAEKMSFNQIKVNEQTLVHSNHRLTVTKRSRIDENVRVLYDSVYNPRFKTGTSFKYEINGKAPRGSIYFYREGELESFITIQVGTLTMDIRKPKN